MGKLTTFILAGGNDHDTDDFGIKLAKFFASRIENPKILDVEFSKPEDEWRASFDAWTDWYKKFFDDVENELAKPETFFDQVAKSDAIFLHGGTTKLLLAALPDYEEARDAFRGKIIFGSSAGANYLSQNNYSPNQQNYQKGAGIIRANVVVHYGAPDFASEKEWREIAANVAKCDASVPTILLPEHEFVVIEEII